MPARRHGPKRPDLTTECFGKRNELRRIHQEQNSRHEKQKRKIPIRIFSQRPKEFLVVYLCRFLMV